MGWRNTIGPLIDIVCVQLLHGVQTALRCFYDFPVTPVLTLWKITWWAYIISLLLNFFLQPFCWWHLLNSWAYARRHNTWPYKVFRERWALGKSRFRWLRMSGASGVHFSYLHFIVVFHNRKIKQKYERNVAAWRPMCHNLLYGLSG